MAAGRMVWKSQKQKMENKFGGYFLDLGRNDECLEEGIELGMMKVFEVYSGKRTFWMYRLIGYVI